jgi:hypothetical protein
MRRLPSGPYSGMLGDTETTRIPGISGCSSGSHWRRVMYVTSWPSADRRSPRLRYHFSAPPTVQGYRQS